MIARIIDASGVRVRRVVASGGGSRVTAWMSAVADATQLPVDAVAVPDGRPAARPTWRAWRPDWRPHSTTRTVGRHQPEDRA